MFDFLNRPLSRHHDLDPGPHRTAIVLVASIMVERHVWYGLWLK